MDARRRRRRPGENRERLIDAGLLEFGRLGYHGAATGAIAARAGVPQPHVYASFRTKRELFLACIDRSGALLEGFIEGERHLAAVSAAGDPSPAIGDAPRDAAPVAGDTPSLDDARRCLLQAVAAAADPAIAGAVRETLHRIEVELRDHRCGTEGVSPRAVLLDAVRAGAASLLP